MSQIWLLNPFNCTSIKLRYLTVKEDEDHEKDGDEGEVDVASSTHFMFYNYAALIMGFFATAITMTNWFGDSINCSTFASRRTLNDNVFTSFCHVKSGFYQWVWIVLILQVFINYLPSNLWRYLEGGKVKKLLHKNFNFRKVAVFLTSYPTYFSIKEAVAFYTCNILALACSIIQLLLMNHFLGGATGISLIPPEVFSRTGSCNMAIIGDSGESVNFSGMCSMNYNFLYEKMYMILYIMTVFLMVLSSIQVIVQTMLMISPELRAIWVKSTLGNRLSAREIDIAIDSYPQFVLFMLIWNSFIEPKEVAVLVHLLSEFKKNNKDPFIVNSTSVYVTKC